MKTIILITLLYALQLNFAYAQKARIDKFSEFPGGGQNFYEYVQKNVKYPADARVDSLSGHVYVEFVVGVDGSIKNESVRILKSLSPSCDAEALRVIKNAPKWTAAVSQSKAIEQTVSFPVTFRFE